VPRAQPAPPSLGPAPFSNPAATTPAVQVPAAGSAPRPAAAVPTPAQQTYIKPVVSVPETPASVEPVAAAQQHRFRSWLLVINGVAVGLLTLGVWGYLRSRRRSKSARDFGLSSDDKDLLLDESREIYPGIYHHPQGFFLARGRRGRRRLFRTALFAILYRDFGVKLGEIQI
jgi:hypothetical protein